MLDGKAAPDRESERKQLFYKFEILNSENQHIGLLGDITENGLKVISEAPVQLNKIFQLKINLPSGISEKKQIVFSAESLWCKKVGQSYQIGFKAQHTDPENVKIIKTIMDLLASPENLLL